jgi:hypothetical protein
MGERRNVQGVLVGKPKERRLFERPRRRWENNIKMDLREMGGEQEQNRSYSGQGKMADSCKCGDELQGFLKREELLD